MNWPRYVVEYGDVIAVTLMMASVFGAMLIVLRGFQTNRLFRNLLSGVGIVACCLCLFASLQYIRIAPQKMKPLKPVFNAVGQRAPDLVYISINDGSIHRLSEFAGKVVVLNIWATWCAPCQDELPDLNRLQQAYGDRLVVLTLTDEDQETIINSNLLSTLVVFKGRVKPGTEDGLFVRPDVARPVTHIIDSKGILRNTFVGQQTFSQFESEVVPYLSPTT